VHAGEEVRIARAMLGDADAEALLTATGRSIAVPALAPPPAEALGALLDDPRLDRDLVEAITADILDRRARIDDLVEDRAELLLPPLMEAARPAEAAASAAARDAALAAIRDYYWVQVRSGVAWLDVSPDTAVIAVPAAEDTFAPADLPDTLRHTVRLRVIVELEDAAGRHEETLLTWTGAPADLDGGVFTLSHDGQGLDALDQVAATADAEARMLGILDGVTAWTPILRANGELVVENLFTRDGTVRPVDATAFTATGGAAGALFAEAATVLGGGEQAMVEPATPTAEWLEIEINVPGEAPRIERRTIFDMVGPAARNAGATVAFTTDQLRDRALRLLGATEILIVGATPSDVEVTLRGAAALAEVADNIGAFASQPEPPTMGNFPFTPRIGMTLLRFASTRLPAASLTAVASPNVFLTHDRLAWDPKSGIVRQIAFDIVFNEVTAPADVFATRVRQGLVDTILEDALMAEGRSANTAAFHAADVAADRPWRTLTAADGAALAALPPDARALIEAQLVAGDTIVAPVAWTDTPPGLSRWRIDQHTGTTLGMMPFGGLSLIEGAYLFYQGATTAACFFIVAASVRAAIGGNLSTELAAIGMLACAGAMAGGAAAATGAGGFGTAAAGAAGGTGLAGAATILAALLAQAIW